jgi:rhamnosyltransferase
MNCLNADKVAVILAACDGENYISSQVVSILNQLDCEVDLYIADDSRSNKLINELNKFNNLKKLIYSKNVIQSGSPAGNFFKTLKSINLTEYNYIAFSDQDDVWFPDKLKCAIESMTSNLAEGYSSDLLAFDHSIKSAWHLSKNTELKKFDYLFQGASAGCTYVLSRRAATLVISTIGNLATSFPNGHSHDWLIYAICRSHGLKWFHDDRAFIAYRQHAHNVFGAMPGIRGFFRRFTILRSGWYQNQILWHRQFLAGSQDEVKLLDAIETLSFMDRVYLTYRCFDLRRSRKDCLLLSALIMLGLI